MSLHLTSTDPKNARPGLSQKKEAQLRSFYKLSRGDDLPLFYGPNPYFQLQQSFADGNTTSLPWSSNVERFNSGKHEQVLRKIDFERLFEFGELGDSFADREDRTKGKGKENASTATENAEGSKGLKALKTLSVGRASITLLVLLSDGSRLVLKAYHGNPATSTEGVPMQFYKERRAYSHFVAAGLTLEPLLETSNSVSSSFKSSSVAPFCYGYFEIPSLSKSGIEKIINKCNQAAANSNPTSTSSIGSSTDQSKATFSLKQVLKLCSHGLLIDYLSPELGWSTLQGSPSRPSCQSAIQVLESLPFLHNDTLPRNVMVKKMNEYSAQGSRDEASEGCSTLEERDDKDDGQRFQAVWIDFASSTSCSEVESWNEKKLKELTITWSKFFDSLLPIQATERGSEPKGLS